MNTSTQECGMLEVAVNKSTDLEEKAKALALKIKEFELRRQIERQSKRQETSVVSLTVSLDKIPA